jgi:hypothetical protein
MLLLFVCSTVNHRSQLEFQLRKIKKNNSPEGSGREADNWVACNNSRVHVTTEKGCEYELLLIRCLFINIVNFLGLAAL